MNPNENNSAKRQEEKAMNRPGSDKKSFGDRAGDALEKAGEKIAHAGAEKLGQKIHDAGDRMEKHHKDPGHPSKV